MLSPRSASGFGRICPERLRPLFGWLFHTERNAERGVDSARLCVCARVQAYQYHPPHYNTPVKRPPHRPWDDSASGVVILRLTVAAPCDKTQAWQTSAPRLAPLTPRRLLVKPNRYPCPQPRLWNWAWMTYGRFIAGIVGESSSYQPTRPWASFAAMIRPSPAALPTPSIKSATKNTHGRIASVTRQAEWAREKRLWLLAQFGGVCQQCKSTERLQFHSTNQAGWIAHRSGRTGRICFYLKEFFAGRLQLLCQKCHTPQHKV